MILPQRLRSWSTLPVPRFGRVGAGGGGLMAIVRSGLKAFLQFFNGDVSGLRGLRPRTAFAHRSKAARQRRTPGTQASCVAILVLIAIMSAASLALAGDSRLYVAVGGEGRRVTSRDGFVWENDQRWKVGDAQEKGDGLMDIVFGGGRFVAVGGGAKAGWILSSTDGRDWREFPMGAGAVSTIAFGNGRFVAVHAGELLASADGERFQAGERLNWKGTIHARRSACGDTEAGFRFVIIGDVELESEQKQIPWRGSTEDGSRWDHSAVETPEVRDVAYGAGLFVAVGPDGRIESSHDGQTWQMRASTPGEDFARIVWTGTRFFVTGAKVPRSSADGITWTKEAVEIPCRVIWARDGSTALGLSWSGEMLASRDLREWKKAAVSPGPPLQAAASRAVESP
jgi:hypothetical protein